MKAVAFVPVRLTSSRLPEKHLKLIGDKFLLSWVIERLKNCQELDEIVICAPDEPESEKLKDICKQEGVKLYIYKGDVNDVVGRLTKASKHYDADICVLASGDCPLLNSETIDRLVRYLKENPEYYRVVLSKKDRKGPIHEGILVARREVWELADKLSDTPELREHQFPVIRIYPDKFSHFKTAEIEDKDIFYNLTHKISVDTPSDLEFMNRIYDELKKRNKVFNLENVINLLKEDPKLKKINDHVYRKGLKDKSSKILFFVSAVSKYGFGNLMRALEIGARLTDEGLGVKFFVLDRLAKDLCEERYFKAIIVENYEEILSYISKYDLVAFDINRDLSIPESFIERLKKSKKKTVFIDNIRNGAKIADLIIIPTAHYVGKNLPNLFHGAKFVVIRKEFLESKERKVQKSGIIARVDKKYRDCIINLWKEVQFVDSFTKDFHLRVLNSSMAIFHFGLSCYEALYVNTPVIVIPRDEFEIQEIKEFNKFAINGGKDKLGDGAREIAKKIKELLYEDIS